MRHVPKHIALAALLTLTGCSTLTINTTDQALTADLDIENEIATLEDGLANGMVEPDPIEAGAVISQQDLWDRLRAGFALNLDQGGSRVKVQRDWYARHPAYLDRVGKRGERYLHYIIEEAEKRNMPLELALLPIVESAFDPFAYSHGRAAGPWQFIPSTGRMFGMNQGYWADQRRDIIASTDAALTYLQRYAERFDGDWLLALAAYNAGGGTVNKAIRRNKRNNQPTDFWSLKLPKETRAYVPKLIALSQIVKEPEKFGIALHPIANEGYFEIVDTGGQIDLAQAAKLADISMEELYLLNPAFNQWATDPNGPHRLLIPKSYAEKFRTALAALPQDQRMQWQRYTIRSGDSLITIAKRHGVTVQMLRNANKLRGNTIIAGESLLIPVPGSTQSTYSLSEDQRLADRQNRAVNNATKVSHTVRRGDTLWDLASQHNVSIASLAKWNNMAPRDPLRVGQTLAIWVPRSASRTSPQASNRPEMIRKVKYSVRRGDSLSVIASRFNVSVSEITKWNQINRKKYLQPGQRLTLYVDVRDAF